LFTDENIKNKRKINEENMKKIVNYNRINKKIEKMNTNRVYSVIQNDCRIPRMNEIHQFILLTASWASVKSSSNLLKCQQNILFLTTSF
jgi:hypothetical protein